MPWLESIGRMNYISGAIRFEDVKHSNDGSMSKIRNQFIAACVFQCLRHFPVYDAVPASSFCPGIFIFNKVIHFLLVFNQNQLQMDF